MIVCICRDVREREIRELVARIGPGVRMRDLREHLGVGAECGKCVQRAQVILQDCGGCAGGRRRERSEQPVIGPVPATAAVEVPLHSSPR